MDSVLSAKLEQQDAGSFEKLPVTVLSGFLGSGKTTLLQHLLENNHGMRIAMIVNDMASINIDASRSHLVQKEAKMVKMQNGCICCTLREDLLLEIKKLALQNEFDYLLIESTGVSEPLPVAETFTFGQLEEHKHKEDGEDDAPAGDEEDVNAMKVLSDVAKLDCMVTVMDARQFFDHLKDDATLFEKWGDREEIAKEDGGRSVCDLLIDQIEFANVIMLNKIDLVSEEELNQVIAIVQRLNPCAVLATTHYANVPPEAVMNTGLFDLQKAKSHAGWLRELRGHHIPESIEYGISSFVYRSRKPMSSARFAKIFSNGTFQKERVIRAKGSLWLDCCEKMVTSFDIAGAHGSVYASHPWFIELVKNEPEVWKGMDTNFRLQVIKDFIKGPQGDKRQEMVFIGMDMNEQRIRKLVDSCLLTDKEMIGDWTDVPNPLQVSSERVSLKKPKSKRTKSKRRKNRESRV